MFKTFENLALCWSKSAVNFWHPPYVITGIAGIAEFWSKHPHVSCQH
jgi:hypothetical protein